MAIATTSSHREHRAHDAPADRRPWDVLALLSVAQ
jgi:hypothetical protein